MSGRRDCTGLAGTNHRPAQIYSKSQLVTGALVSSAQPQVPPHTSPSPSIKVDTFSAHEKSQLPDLYNDKGSESELRRKQRLRCFDSIKYCMYEKAGIEC